jgi:hypothetical protein
MDSETIDLSSMTTTAIATDVMVTHMQRIYNLLSRCWAHVGLAEPIPPALFGELQMAVAVLFKDICELTLRLGILAAKGQLD